MSADGRVPLTEPMPVRRPWLFRSTHWHAVPGQAHWLKHGEISIFTSVRFEDGLTGSTLGDCSNAGKPTADPFGFTADSPRRM